MIAAIVDELAPELIKRNAVGYESASQLLITAGDVAVAEKSPTLYGNCQSVPRRETWSGKSVAVLGAAI